MNLLHLEDSDADAELIGELIATEWPDFQIERVQTEEEFVQALHHSRVDLILADLALPGFDGMSALSIARDVRPEVPFIFLSGTMREDDAVETLRNGATDYILKDRIGRLVPAIRRALTEREEDQPMPQSHDLNSRLAMRFVHLEDSESDAELASEAISREWPDATIQRVHTREGFTAALQNPKLDMILSDFSMPGFDGLSALAIAQSRRPDVPFIFVSGTIGEENAIAALKKGASDYILKDRMRRLRPAIRRALDDYKDRRDRPSSGRPASAERSDDARPPGESSHTEARGAKIGLWDWDILTNASWLSDGVYAALGYSHGEISTNIDTWAKLVHPKESRRVSEKVIAALDGSRARWSDEFHVPAQERRLHPCPRRGDDRSRRGRKPRADCGLVLQDRGERRRLDGRSPRNRLPRPGAGLRRRGREPGRAPALAAAPQTAPGPCLRLRAQTRSAPGGPCSGPFPRAAGWRPGIAGPADGMNADLRLEEAGRIGMVEGDEERVVAGALSHHDVALVFRVGGDTDAPPLPEGEMVQAGVLTELAPIGSADDRSRPVGDIGPEKIPHPHLADEADPLAVLLIRRREAGLPRDPPELGLLQVPDGETGVPQLLLAEQRKEVGLVLIPVRPLPDLRPAVRGRRAAGIMARRHRRVSLLQSPGVGTPRT